MHFTKTLSFLALASLGANAYVIDAFRGNDCSGESKHVNVWDNTCRSTNIFPTKSVRVKKYGAGGQKATFFLLGGCGAPSSASKSFWAGGGDSGFQIGTCIDFGVFQMNAYGSVAG
ncbi:hypothetical protein BJY04DRAFT_213703 [Aspergillus karnatakaensis]|uniref:uncharacterized protein n=1 Tax=Aspergillus karnatakaensis TaxID=1810916 RepID=UPI003CCD2E74